MKVGYLCSRYPYVSHTFIRREVEMLRERGVEVHTFTVRRPVGDEIVSEEDRREQESTWSILPCSPWKLLAIHLRALCTRPAAYGATLMKALRHRVAGFRAMVWSIFYFIEAIRLADELAKRRIDHLHNHFSNAGGDVGYLASAYLGIPWSVTLHGSSDFDSPNQPLLGKKIAAAKFTACVTHYGRGLAMWASDCRHWPRIILVRCGLDVGAVPFRGPQWSGNGRPRILAVGRLSPEKGHVGLVEAFAEACRRGVDAELVIIGEGTERERIEAAARAAGVSDRCHLPGAKSTTEVLAAMREANVFAMSSFMEGLPVVIMEAMSVGVPVVAPTVAGIPELVIDGVTGLLYPAAHWSRLADQLVRALEDAPLRESMIVAARHAVEREFDIAQAVKPLLTQYGATVDAPAAQPESETEPVVA